LALSDEEYQRRVENARWIQRHRRRFCPRCGSYGRVYGDQCCEHCRDDYDRENIEAFLDFSGGKPFVIFDNSNEVHLKGDQAEL